MKCIFGIPLLSSLCVMMTLTGYCQSFQPIFEDGEGKTAIVAPQGFFGVNTANSSLRFQYFYAKSAKPDPANPRLVGKWNRFFAGVNVTASATDGVGTLISGGRFRAGSSADLFLGHKSLLFGTVDRRDRTGETVRYYFGKKKVTISDWLTFRAGLQTAKYTLYDPTALFSQQISTQIYRGSTLQLVYTLLFNGATSVGFSWDRARINNIGELAQVSFKEQRTVTDPATATVRVFEDEVSAYQGVFATSMRNNYSLDVVHFLNSNLQVRYAIHAYGRARPLDSGTLYRSGLGFYVFPKGKIFGGVFVESNDLTNQVSSTPDFLKRTNIGLTIKFVLPSIGSIE